MLQLPIYNNKKYENNCATISEFTEHIWHVHKLISDWGRISTKNDYTVIDCGASDTNILSDILRWDYVPRYITHKSMGAVDCVLGRKYIRIALPFNLEYVM